jgi:YYY domain-containing protein
MENPNQESLSPLDEPHESRPEESAAVPSREPTEPSLMGAPSAPSGETSGVTARDAAEPPVLQEAESFGMESPAAPSDRTAPETMELPASEEAESPGAEAAPEAPRRMTADSARREDAAPPAADFLQRLRRHAFEILLGALILTGVYFRFAGNNWSEGTNLNPDELGVNNVVAGIEIPATLGEYFNTRISPLSPYLKYDEEGNRIGEGPDPGMVWGQWPSILIRATAEALTGVQQAVLPAVNGAIQGMCGEAKDGSCPKIQLVDYTTYGEIRLLGRFLSALTDTITLLVILAIGLRLYNRRIALLAAALSALAVTQIQQSHFMTIDNFGVMFAALSMYCAVRAAQKGGWRWYALFGVFYGMTLASRSNFAPLGGMILVAVIIGQWETIKTALHLPAKINLPAPEPAPGLGDASAKRAAVLQVLVPAGMFALAVAATLLSFRIAQPMAFRAATGDTGFFTLHLNPDWLERMKYAETVSSGSGYISGYPPAEHWANRPAILTPLISILLWGMGLPLGLAAFGGLLWAGIRAFHGVDWRKHALPVLFAGGMFLFLGTRWVKEMRYFLVIYPFLSLLAAWALMELWTKAKLHRGAGKKALAAGAIGVVLIGTLLWAWKFSEIYRTENTRLQASRWMYQNFPAAFRLTMRLDSGETFQQGANFYNQPIEAEPVRLSFRAARSGTVEEISLGYVADLSGSSASLMHVDLVSEPAGPAPLAQIDIPIPTAGQGDRGQRVAVAFGPVKLEEGREYRLFVSAVQGGPFSVKGAWFVDEDWDEPLPFNLDGFDANLMFDRADATRMNIEWPDGEEKRQMLIDNLSRADYVIIQSQRRIWSVCRMPAVYPMTMEYYRALFDGRLGFDLVAVFQHPFTFGPLQISDLAGSVTVSAEGQPGLPIFNLNPFAAEESFSVYDHAPVWIFAKRADFSQSNVAALLGAVDLTHLAKQDAGQSFGILNGLMLPQERLEEQQAGGTWSEMFSYEWIWNTYPGLAAGMWWAWAVLTGWAALPIVALAFGGLPDRGYSLARVAGWLLVAWAAWLLGSYRVPFVWTTIAALWAALLLTGGILAWCKRAEWKEQFRDLRKTWLTMEIVFAAFFLFDLLLRFGYGDLWHLWTGGEKPMDFSYLNAVIRSTSFPPYDPWFSGGYLNYYYFGFVLVAIPIKLLGTVPSIGYNLALPLLFGTLGLATYGVVWNLVESLRRKGAGKISPLAAGIGAAVMLAVLGNLGEVRFIWNGLIAVSQLSIPHGLFFGLGDSLHALAGGFRVLTKQTELPGGLSEWYWNASRAIQFPPGPNGEYITDWSITEFPFFTFLYADLHAHLIAMPLILLSLAGSVAMVVAPERLKRWQSALPLVGLTALAVGSLWPTNGWNYPISLAIALVGLAFAGWLMLSREGRLTDWRAWVWLILLAGVLAGLSVWLFQPYYDWYGAGHTSFVRWKGPKTPLDSYLIIHGLFLFIIVTYLFSQTRQWFSQLRVPKPDFLQRWGGAVLVCFGLLAAGVVILAVLGYPVLVLAVPLIFWSIVLGLRKGLEDEHRLILGLIAISLAITCIVEIVVLANDMDRQNTVFKFYIQAWIFFAVSAGAALGWLVGRVGEWGVWLRRAWIAALSLLVAGALLYTVAGSISRIDDRMSSDSPRSLDGIAFMPYVTYSFIDDYSNATYDLRETYDAIRWLQENAAGSPVIVQSPWPHYRGGLPYTMFTGLPAVLGWNYHQRQQRGVVADAWVWERDGEIENFYKSYTIPEAREFIRKYRVRYIIVGQQERAYYGAEGLIKFEQMEQAGELRSVFAEGQTVIYEVVT